MDSRISYIRQNFFKTQQKNLKIAGISLALEFLSDFYNSLGELVTRSSNKNVKLEKFNIYNYELDKVMTVEIDIASFQIQLNYFYRQFVRKKIMTKFKWYNDFFTLLIQICITKFNFDNEDTFLIDIFIDSLILYSCGKNEYNYNQIRDYYISKLRLFNVDYAECESIFDEFFNVLEENNLVTRKKFLFGIDQYFNLSDKFIDSYFISESLNLPQLSSSKDCLNLNNAYISADNLESLSKVINGFNNNIVNRQTFNSFKKNFELMYLNNNVIDSIFDLNTIELDLNKISNLPDDITSFLAALYNYKLLLNEYCFQVVIVSCFDYYYDHPNLVKNVLLKKK